MMRYDRKIRSGNGSVLIELALVTPLVLLLVAFCYEYGRTCLLKNEMYVLAREGANLVFKNCVSNFSSKGTGAVIPGCVTATGVALQQLIAQTRPNAILVLSVYQGGAVVNQTAIVASDGLSTGLTKIDSTVAGGFSSLSVAAPKNYVVVGEAFYSTAGQFRFFPDVMTTVWGNNQRGLYEVALF